MSQILQRRTPKLPTTGPLAAAAALVLPLLFATLLFAPERAQAETMAVVEIQIRGQEAARTPETAERLGRLVAPGAGRELLPMDEALTRAKRALVVPPQHETTQRLDAIYAEIRRGDELLYTDPEQAIPVLDKARQELEQIVQRLSLDETVHQKLFQTQMLLARSHLDNGDKRSARKVVEAIIVQFGKRDDVTEDNYHPRLVELYQSTARRLERRRSGSLRVTTKGVDGMEILLNRTVVADAKTPHVITDLLPGHYHVQVRRSASDVSKIHRIEVKRRGESRIDIDFAYDKALMVGPDRLGFTFDSKADMDTRLAEYASRLGRLLEVDEVLLVGLLPNGDGDLELRAQRLAVGSGKSLESAQLAVRGDAPRDAQYFRATEMLCGLEAGSSGVPTPPTGPKVAEPWYTNWLGWTLVGAGVGCMGAGAYYTYDYWDKRDCATDPSCGTQASRVKAADEAMETSEPMAITFWALGGALVTGGVLAFILWERESDAPATAGFERRTAPPLFVPTAYPGGGGFTFQTRF